MTINATRTRELDIGKICQRSLNLCGYLNEHQAVSEEDLSMAKDFLELIVDELQAEGLRSRAIEFIYVELEADEASYTLDTDVLDIIGDGQYIEPGETDLDNPSSETTVSMIDRATWQSYGAKDSTGQPTMFYVHRTTSPPTVRVLPIPDASADGGSIRFQAHRLVADCNDESKTMDLERFAASYIQYELAHRWAAAKSMNMGRVQYFGSIARQKLEVVKNYSAQRTAARMVVRHRTGWGRRR